jgi:hypothetical protein
MQENFMHGEVHIGAPWEKERKRCWPGRLAIVLGQALLLVIYLLMLERYGFPLLNLDDDEDIGEERVFEAVP